MVFDVIIFLGFMGEYVFMEKIFLVEDEVIVREGIKNNIDWGKNGFDFAGEARDGELAFPLIQKIRPDIVITDIKMPFMDGLELSRLIKKELPDTEIILLTGYEEFTYAKEGIELGVAQYLTKPISGDDLLAETNKVADKIRAKKLEQALKIKYREEMEEKQKNKQTNVFSKIVSGNSSMAEIMEMAGNCDLDISAVCYNILLFGITPKTGKYDAYSDDYIELEKCLMQFCKEMKIILFERKLEGKALLIKADSLEELLEKQKKMVEKIEQVMKSYPQLRYFGGFGEPVERMTELNTSFENAQKAFSQRFFTDEEKLVFSEEIIRPQGTSDEFNISSMDISQVDKHHVLDFLKTGEKDEAGYFVENFVNNNGNNFMQSLMFRQYIVMDVYLCVVNFVEGLGHNRSEIEAIDVNAGIVSKSDNSLKYLVRILKQAISVREASATNRYKEIVDNVIAYINENFADAELSLNTLASHVNVSPNHLSMIFSQQTGKNFIKYLTDYRMNKAKELLRCTNLRSSEIADQVGYHDPHYFSYLFKKTMKVTPTQYRGNND